MADFTSRLNFCWDNYLKMINLFMTLTSGTFVVIMTVVSNGFIQELSKPPQVLSFVGIIFLFLALCCVIAWRIYAQAGMEKEILGSHNNLTEYVKSVGIGNPITDLETNEKKLAKNLILVKWLYGGLLLTSWVLFMASIYLISFS